MVEGIGDEPVEDEIFTTPGGRRSTTAVTVGIVAEAVGL